MHNVSCQICDKTPLDCCCSFSVSVSARFPCLRKAWQFLNRVKRKKKFLFIDAWMTSWTDRKGTESRRRGTDTTECLCTCIMHIHFQSYVHRQEAHTSAPHLPRYQNTISPDKLECERACRFLTLQVSVTFLSELHVVSHRDKETQNEPTCHPSLSLSIPLLCLSPLGFVERSRNMEQKSTSHAALFSVSHCNCWGFHKRFSNKVHGLIVNETGSYGFKLKI